MTQLTFEFLAGAGMTPTVGEQDRLAAEIELRFLETLIRANHASIHDGYADLLMVHEDDGKWVGPIPNRLNRQGIIESVTKVVSDRPSRRGDHVTLWRLLDPKRAARRVETLRSMIDEMEGSTDA